MWTDEYTARARARREKKIEIQILIRIESRRDALIITKKVHNECTHRRVLQLHQRQQ